MAWTEAQNCGPEAAVDRRSQHLTNRNGPWGLEERSHRQGTPYQAAGQVLPHSPLVKPQEAEASAPAEASSKDPTPPGFQAWAATKWGAIVSLADWSSWRRRFPLLRRKDSSQPALLPRALRPRLLAPKGRQITGCLSSRPMLHL